MSEMIGTSDVIGVLLPNCPDPPFRNSVFFLEKCKTGERSLLSAKKAQKRAKQQRNGAFLG